jgi:hypothetical protein
MYGLNSTPVMGDCLSGYHFLRGFGKRDSNVNQVKGMSVDDEQLRKHENMD